VIDFWNMDYGVIGYTTCIERQALGVEWRWSLLIDRKAIARCTVEVVWVVLMVKDVWLC
jgi:hypothetical protein